jgi:hypothetical protein
MQRACRFDAEQRLIDPYIMADFLAESTVPNGRTMLFVCEQCGDIACGAITLNVARRAGLIVWSDFRYQTSSSDEDTVKRFDQVGPFEFDFAQYKVAILQQMGMLAG